MEKADFLLFVKVFFILRQNLTEKLKTAQIKNEYIV